MVYATGSIPAAFMQWSAEEEFEKKGFFSSFKRKAVQIKTSNDCYYHGSYHCADCKRVVAEFPTS